MIWLTLSRGCGYGSPHSCCNMVQFECLTAHCPILWECYLHAIFWQLLSLLYTTQGTCDAKTFVLSTVWKYTLLLSVLLTCYSVLSVLTRLSIAERTLVHDRSFFFIIMAGMAVFNVAGYLIEERRRWPVVVLIPNLLKSYHDYLIFK